MFNFFNRRRRQSELPDLSPAMIDSIRTTVGVCSRQIEQYFGSGIVKMPFITPWHDKLVGTYSWGFLHGIFLVNHADIAWAKGDEGLSHLGFGAAMLAVLSGLILTEDGSDPDGATRRILTCHERLLELHSADPTEEWRKVDAAGGADGMAIARGDPLPKGGYLLFFLQRNVTPEEKLRALGQRRAS